MFVFNQMTGPPVDDILEAARREQRFRNMPPADAKIARDYLDRVAYFRRNDPRISYSALAALSIPDEAFRYICRMYENITKVGHGAPLAEEKGRQG